MESEQMTNKVKIIRASRWTAFKEALNAAKTVGFAVYFVLRKADGRRSNAVEVEAKHTVKLEGR